MSFLSSAKERIRLDRLRKELEAEPRPHGLAELARALLARGEPEAALDVLSRAEELFEGNEDLRRVRGVVSRLAAESRLAAAKARLESAPSVATFLELADAYRFVGRSDRCLETLLALIERFGENSTALVQLGELRYRRFLDSLSTTDGVATEEYLRRAHEAEPEALKPRFLLAEFDYRIGAVERSRARLSELLAMEPNHERARLLLDSLPEPDDSGDAPMGVTGDDLLSRLSVVEERVTVPSCPWEDQTDDADVFPEDPEPELDRLLVETGAESAGLFGDGDRVWSTGPASPMSEIVPRVRDVFQRAARGMDLGAPSRLWIEGADGALVVEIKRGAALSLLVRGDVDSSLAAVSARDAVERIVNQS